MEEVFERLKCTKNGLTSEEVEERIAEFGYNKLEEKKVNWPFHSFKTKNKYSRFYCKHIYWNC